MYIEGKMTGRQLQGPIVCLPKNTNSQYVEDNRPFILLNTDYKILARIIANRLRPCMTEILHRNQHGGLQGNSAFDAVAAVRAVAYAEVTRIPLRIFSIDFSAAFDKISHYYLMSTIHDQGFLTGSKNE